MEFYGVHITQENNLSKVMSDSLLRAIKKHGAAAASCKDPGHYLASFMLPTRERQTAFWRELNEAGIKAVADVSPSDISKSGIKEFLQGWGAN